MNYGYKNHCLYLHSVKEGKKIEIIRANPNVCFEVDVDLELVDGGQVACNLGMKFISVIGQGKARIIEDKNQKKTALNLLMEQYAKGKEYVFQDKQIDAVTMIEMQIEGMSCKKSVYYKVRSRYNEQILLNRWLRTRINN